MGSLERAAHPLAARLIERLGERPGSRVLDFAAGSGRNGAMLRAAGFDVTAIDDRVAESASPLAGIAIGFAAALTTHGMLHGTEAVVAARVDAVADHIEPRGLLFATFGSTRDARFGRGKRIGDFSFAPTDGDEGGIAHAFFDERRLRELLNRRFAIDLLEEHDVDAIVGKWAHGERPLSGAVHWFACLTAR